MNNSAPPPSASQTKFWRRNLTLTGVLLVIWFLVSLGAGILFVDFLDQFRIPGTGFKLGFWFAQQGSIFIFIILIGIYVVCMNRLEAAARLENPKKSTGADNFEI